MRTNQRHWKETKTRTISLKKTKQTKNKKQNRNTRSKRGRWNTTTGKGKRGERGGERGGRRGEGRGVLTVLCEHPICKRRDVHTLWPEKRCKWKREERASSEGQKQAVRSCFPEKQPDSQAQTHTQIQATNTGTGTCTCTGTGTDAYRFPGVTAFSKVS